jgi:hypothetical protein
MFQSRSAKELPAFAPEVQRLMGIVTRHAVLALAKPETQRDSHLAYCRANWKRYAAGVTRNQFEWERFAAALDRATRDTMALLQAHGDGLARSEQPAQSLPADEAPAIADAEIALWAHDLGYDLPAPSAPIHTILEAAEASATLEMNPVGAGADGSFAISHWDGVSPRKAAAEEREAEEQDRQGARFGFDRRLALAGREVPENVVPIADSELQRKVQAVLRARQDSTRVGNPRG